jgi:two-component system nitrate/nitrite response regulator NarL
MPLHSPARVLVVDDQPSIRAGLRLLIDSEHPRLHSVGAAGNCAEALALVRRLQPDLVLLDVDLDGEDGLALVPRLRHESSCRVVVFTSMLSTPVRQRALQLGVHDCLAKTTPARELLACLVAACPPGGGVELSCPPGRENPVHPGEFSDGGRAGLE